MVATAVSLDADAVVVTVAVLDALVVVAAGEQALSKAANAAKESQSRIIVSPKPN